MKSEGTPQLHTIENTDTPQAHRERKLERLDIPQSERDRNESLRLAQETLLHNDKLYEFFLNSIIQIGSHHNTRKFIEVENIFISKLQELSDIEIDSVIRQFNIGFKEYVSRESGKFDIDLDLHRKIFENDAKNNKEARGNIHSNAIKNVIYFIRSRKNLLESNPSQQYGFYFEHSLDAENKIDLIECIFEELDGETHVAIMNLIQIKSSIPTKEEQDNITKAHTDWIKSSVMDLQSFEKEYSDGIPPGLTIEMLSENVDDIEELLLDLCTDPNGFNPDRFIERLDLEKMTNKHKAWLLAKYGTILKKKIHDSVEHGVIEQINADLIIEKLTELEEKVRSKAKLPRNLSYIDTIKSITAVGKQIVHEEILVTHTEEKAKRKIIKIQ
ncbi:MAG: hypothetical protein V4473_02545 [Patescibacteria group bacterium]